MVRQRERSPDSVCLCKHSRFTSSIYKWAECDALIGSVIALHISRGYDGTRVAWMHDWSFDPHLDTTAALHSHESLWPGVYKLRVMVSDAQGLSCPAGEAFTLHVCTCVGSDSCHFGAAKRATSSSELSAAAMGMLLLALFLLLRESSLQQDILFFLHL